MKLTDEQAAIVRSDAEFLRVAAFAGTGKTSTLVEFARARPAHRMLYVAFNKAMQKEAAGKFPSNVTCRTSHSLAFASEGLRYQRKLVNSIRPHQILMALGQTSGTANSYSFAMQIRKLLLHWLASDKTSIAESWPQENEECDQRTRESIISCSKKIWEMMRDPADSRIGMVHDGYLKLYQLSDPLLHYDYILFDEVQDSNPVTSDIMVHQQCRKVFVGDSHQQIYSFRGAVDAMKRTDFSQTLYLTGSFRFPQSIAEVANSLLRIKGEVHRIRGLAIEPGIESKAVLTRGNALLFEKAVLEIKRGGHIYFVGGFKGYKFELLRDIYWLLTNQRDQICDDFIRRFHDFEALKEYADRANERDLSAWCKVAQKYSNIPDLIDGIERSTVLNSADATLNLATAHKAKGLEFGEVTIGDDFPSILFSRAEPDAITAQVEEINLLYVASTRAQNQLDRGPVIESLCKHLLIYPMAQIKPILAVPAPITTHSDSEVLELILAGRDPQTGGRLSVDSLRTESVKKALGKALELLQNTSRHKPNISNKNRNAGNPWSTEEDKRLLTESQDGLSIKELAGLHQRTEGAIRSRLEKLVGIPHQNSGLLQRDADFNSLDFEMPQETAWDDLSTIIGSEMPEETESFESEPSTPTSTHMFQIGEEIVHTRLGKGVVESIWGEHPERVDIRFFAKGNVVLSLPNSDLKRI